MKCIKIYISCIAICLSLLSFGQKIDEDDVPKSVLKAFEDKYPDEKSPKWEIDVHGYYEAHFKDDGIKYRADFFKEGIWRETENSIKFGELPKPIKRVLKSKYDDEEINEIEHVLSATKGEFYDVEFKRKGKNKDIEFDVKGNIISQ